MIDKRCAGVAVAVLAGCVLLGGCGPETGLPPLTGENPRFMTEDRLANGMVIVLPGIEGESSMNQDIRYGLVSAGVDQAIPIHRWGSPIPGLSLQRNSGLQLLAGAPKP